MPAGFLRELPSSDMSAIALDDLGEQGVEMIKDRTGGPVNSPWSLLCLVWKSPIIKAMTSGFERPRFLLFGFCQGVVYKPPEVKLL